VHTRSWTKKTRIFRIQSSRKHIIPPNH
jgi:hypothetical protein